jgi:transposase-like protein
MLHRLRAVLRPLKFGNMTKIGGSGTEVEVDEAFVGPDPKNMHKGRKLRYNQQREATGFGGTAVLGMLDRDGREVRAQIVPDVKRDTLQAQIFQNVKYGSNVYTDDAVVYDKLHWRYVHDVVKHAETYVNGRVHTNSLENFWSLFKRNLRGTYVAVEPYHLDRYLDEQMFRYNNRGGKKKQDRVTDAERFNLALSQINGKRLTFAELTGKNGSQAVV